MIVAIDGPASAGKGTAARKLAQKLGFVHIDSGSFYRVVAFHVFNLQIDWENSKLVLKLLPQIDISIKAGEDRDVIISNGRDVTDEIRYDAVSQIVSQVSRIPGVRAWVNQRVREFAEGKNVVVEGRDITTKVFPKAEFKFYLDADLDERAKRRHLELETKGVMVEISQVKADLSSRDESDKNKPGGEMKIAADAIYVDSTNMSVEEVVEFMTQKVKSGKIKRVV